MGNTILNGHSQRDSEILEKLADHAKVRFIAAAALLVSFTIIHFVGLFTISYGAFIVAPLLEMFVNQPYPWILKRIKHPQYAFIINQVFDILIITYGYHFVGGMNMIGLVLAYPLVFIFTGIVLGSGPTYFMANFAFLCYASMVALEYFGIIPVVETIQLEMSGPMRLGTTLLILPIFNIIACYISYWSRLLGNREKDLRNSKQRFEDVASHTQEWIWETGRDGSFIYSSPIIENILGHTSAEVMGKKVYDLFAADGFEQQKNAILATVYKREVFRGFISRCQHKNGNLVLIETEGIPIFDEKGVFRGYRGSGRDITAKKRSEERLRKLSSAVEQSSASVVITDLTGNIEYVNPKFTELTGYSLVEVLGKNPRILKSGVTTVKKYEELWKTLLAGNEWGGELCNKKKNGELYWEYASISPIKEDDGTITHFLAVKEDITLKKEYEKRLLHQANYDELTDLPNRLLALDRIKQAVNAAKRTQKIVAVMFLDLDQFKLINDTLGHAAGDKVLVETARRLTELVRKSDTVARLGGDEFLLVMPDLDAAVYATLVAEKVLRVFSQPFVLDKREVFVTVSIGITIFPNDGDDPQVLLRNADIAMYKAKDDSRNTFRFFRTDMNQQAADRLRMESHLRQALQKNEFVLHYQPLIDVSNGRLTGAEALLRWVNKSEGGMVGPNQFIPLAEETGLIVPIGEWVLRTACQQLKKWHVLQKPGTPPLIIAVNVSPRQFKSKNFIHTVESAIEDSGIAPELLELEITESLLIEDDPKVANILRELNGMGVRLSIDDFGTGYSALSYLRKFSFDTLKIDYSFVHDVTVDNRDAALVVAIIGMAHNLSLKVIGEGVETEAQLAFLRSYGCDGVQGFYFSKPILPDAFTDFIHRQ